MPEQQVPATQPAIEDSNATLFVDGIGAMPSEETWALFRTFGTVLSIKTPPGRSYGFVTYLHRASAEAAMVALSHERSGRGLRVTWSTRPKAEAPQGPDVGAAFPGQAALDPSSMATLSLLGLLPAGGGMAIPQVGMHGAQASG